MRLSANYQISFKDAIYTI